MSRQARWAPPAGIDDVWCRRPSSFPVWMCLLTEARRRNAFSFTISREEIRDATSLHVDTVSDGLGALHECRWIRREHALIHRKGVVVSRLIRVKINPIAAKNVGISRPVQKRYL
jgi:hypothetical protein